MAYQVLARKWRPQKFADVVGQQPVLQALTNALDNHRLHHAYLLTGTRGVGKTTIARIFAKCLSCEQGVSSTPCGACASCLEIEAGRFIDMIEVDAASRTKVEDTRDLLNNVQYAPTQGRYKIYLIDEVHMLSGHSFNALLKTLEEPPPHVIFLLATTDPQKLPITILSRCLKFHLKNMQPDFMVDYLAYVLHQEQIFFEKNALQQLAKKADGSMRDALSLLDQAIAHGNNRVTLADVEAMLGLHDHDYIVALIQALLEKEGQKLLDIIDALALQAADFNYTLEELLSTWQQIAVLQIVANPNTQMDVLNTLAKQLSPEDVQLFYQIALQGRRDLPFAPTQKAGFEMIMLRMLAFYPKAAIDISIPNTYQQTLATTPIQITEETVKIPAKPQPKQAVSLPNNPSAWASILKQLPVSGLTQILLSYCLLANHEENRVELLVDSSQAAMVNETLKTRIKEALSTYFGTDITLKVEIAKTPIECPARLSEVKQQQQLVQATKTIEQDVNIQILAERFGAKIQPNTIEPIKEDRLSAVPLTCAMGDT